MKPIYRLTITVAEDQADAVAIAICSGLEQVYNWARVSDSYPILIKNKLNYTITFTAGNDPYYRGIK